jgi:hypothetical protein
MEKDTPASSTLSDDEQKVWDILTTPYAPQLDPRSTEYIRYLLDEVKASLAKLNNEMTKHNEVR